MPKPSKKQADTLATQLAFVASILQKKGTVGEKCCVIDNGTITARNNGLSVGILTEATLSASPDCHQLIAALSKCKTGYSMSELRGLITVKSGGFTAKLPTVEGLVAAQPDGYYAALGPDLFEAIALIDHISIEDAEHIQTASICVQEGMVSSTNRNVILQAWHGLNLPTMMLPKRFVARVVSSGKSIVGYGHSATSFTVFFDDNSWLKTQLAEAEPLPYSTVCEWAGPWQPFPDIWEAVDAVMPFRGDTAALRLVDGAAQTDTAQHECDWSGEVRLNGDYLKTIKPYCDQYAIDNGKLYFYKDNVRGVLALMVD